MRECIAVQSTLLTVKQPTMGDNCENTCKAMTSLLRKLIDDDYDRYDNVLSANSAALRELVTLQTVKEAFSLQVNLRFPAES